MTEVIAGLAYDVLDSVAFTVHGVPQPQGSIRRAANHAGAYESNKALAPWRQDLVEAAMGAWQDRPRYLGPVEVVVTFAFPRLRSHYGTGRNAGVLKASAPMAHTTKPDTDHLQRAVGDALTFAGVIRDDSQICSWCASKVYGDHPGAHVVIRPL